MFVLLTQLDLQFSLYSIVYKVRTSYIKARSVKTLILLLYKPRTQIHLISLSYLNQHFQSYLQQSNFDRKSQICRSNQRRGRLLRQLFFSLTFDFLKIELVYHKVIYSAVIQFCILSMINVTRVKKCKLNHYSEKSLIQIGNNYILIKRVDGHRLYFQ